MKFRLITLCAALCLSLAPVFADSSADVRRRLEQRLPAIDDLKARQIIGENNQGLVEFRKAGAPQDNATVSDENRDRAAVYAVIAQQTGQSPDAVGRARAHQIAANSRSGVWIQDASGQWRRK